MSLLSKAQAIQVGQDRNVETASDEMIEAAIAYAKHEVSAKQLAAILYPDLLKANRSATLAKTMSTINSTLLSAVRSGKLVLR